MTAKNMRDGAVFVLDFCKAERLPLFWIFLWEACIITIDKGERNEKRKERWQFSMYTGRTIRGGTDTKEKKGKNVLWQQ